MGFVMFAIVLAAGGYAAWRRVRSCPLLRVLSANMDGWAEASRHGPELADCTRLRIVSSNPISGNRLEEREVLASRLVA